MSGEEDKKPADQSSVHINLKVKGQMPVAQEAGITKNYMIRWEALVCGMILDWSVLLLVLEKLILTYDHAKFCSVCSWWLCVQRSHKFLPIQTDYATYADAMEKGRGCRRRQAYLP